MYWRINPFVFSFASDSQEWYRRAKKLGLEPFRSLLMGSEFFSVVSRYCMNLVLVGA